jgi:dihydrofolate reductase
MKIALIAAMSENRVIGREQRLPWHLSADLKRFRQLTLGKPILMGRKTHESIGKPLPGRENLVLSRDPGYQAAGCMVVHSLSEALAAAGDAPELMIVGGATLYREFLPEAHRLYLTLIHQTFSGNAFFPDIDWEDWRETARKTVDDDTQCGFKYSFLNYVRRSHQPGELIADRRARKTLPERIANSEPWPGGTL